MILTNTDIDSTKSQETVCLMIAAGLHALMLFWNPILLASNYKPIHDFVQIDVVETPAPGGGAEPAAPAKMTLMDTLKDMLMKPKTEDIAHVAPEPLTHQVAAPVQPALKERNSPHPIASMFQPKSQTEDLAAASAPNAIKTDAKNYTMPTSNPTLQAKAFGGIRAPDLPFQVGTDQQISGGNATVIPVAIGKGSAKAALGYSAPSLQDAGKHTGIHPGLSAPAGNVSALGGGGPSTIELSGTGGTGNAPTGATKGSVLQDRAGSGGGGGLVGRAMFGSGRGGGVGSGIEGIPSAAAELDAQIATSAGATTRAQGKKGFEIAGPLNNRPIIHKVVPQYPAWAEEQGIIGSVRIWFTVTADGSVRSNMRVTKTTGYPDLDKLALDALKQWRFATFNQSDDSSQWGIITFTFSLSS